MFIYTLSDPRDRLVRYVGATQQPKKRLWEHMNDKRQKCHRVDWIQSLLRQDVRPEMNVIEESADSEWEIREIYWIKYYRDAGFDLTNSTDGGDGIPFMSDEIKEKISRARRERFAGENHPRFGVHCSDETKQRISRANTGRKLTDEHRKKISDANKGHVVSDQQKEKMRLSSLGKKLSDAARLKISEARKGKSPSPESNQKRSVSLTGERNHFFGKTHSDDTKNKIREARLRKKNPK